MKTKKYLLFFLFCFFCTTFIGCKYSQLPFEKKKESNFYYTDQLIKRLSTEEASKISILYLNYDKQKELSKDDISILYQFLNSLNKMNFIQGPKNLPEKPKYKIFITFKKEKYIVNIYNPQYCSIHPWDGDYEMDYIDATTIHTAYNLYGLCKYLIGE